ncbi:HNH/ENDO VII family nuclease [Halomonas sp. Bachu 37]|uniref:HNH/ENDO VII family nuclease n=1 Tax=Halomonas kashgarensis TaxID=3084920 RepID=UPI0032171972
MNVENFSVESLESSSRLALLASEMPDKCMVVEDLDRPIFALTQETRGELPPVSTETRGRLEDGGFPESVLDAVGSEAEANIYENASLEPEQVNGRDVLVRTDIDYEKIDPVTELTNLQRMEKGRPPLDANSKPIELHHIGQKQDSPLAELTSSEHRGQGNDNILHNKIKESEIDREDFDKERQEHWKERANQINSQN